MSSAKHSIAITMLVMALASCGCPFLVPEITVELSDLTLCQGWNAEGEPVALPDVVPPDEMCICVCGHLETNQDVLLQIFWSRERSSLLRNLQVFSNGPFLSCIEEDEGFEPGNYGVAVIGEKTELGHLDFSVGEELGRRSQADDMDILETIRAMLGSFYFILVETPGLAPLLLLSILMAVGANYYNHWNARKNKRDCVLNRIRDSSKLVCLDVRSKITAVAPLGFGVSWQRAEVIFTENSILYFGYHLVLGLFRMYRGFMQLYVQGAELPQRLVERGFVPIDSIKFDNNDLIVTYSWGDFVKRKCTMTLENIDDSSALKAIH